MQVEILMMRLEQNTIRLQLLHHWSF